MRYVNSIRLLFHIYWFSLIGRIIAHFISSRKHEPKSILYLAAFFPENAGFEWRVRKWVESIKKDYTKVEIKYALEGDEFNQLLTKNHNEFLIKSLKRRFWQVIDSRKFETIIVRRELLLYNDYGNLFLEKLLLKIHPNAILDFDDDISAAKNQPKKIISLYGKLLQEDGDKFNNTLKMYSNFIVASNYLKTRIERINNKNTNIAIIPTCVDYNNFPQKKYTEKKRLIFGWIGGTHNYFLLDNLMPIFVKLSKEYSFKLLVIGGEEYKKNVNFEIEFRKWSLETEIRNLLDVDVGLMPLIDDEESKGKGGFKLIQYMGLGIVSIASPITINNEIVDHQKNSFLAKDYEEWEFWMTQLLENKIELQKIGEEARKKINSAYTFSSNRNNYINFIENVRNSRLLEKQQF